MNVLFFLLGLVGMVTGVVLIILRIIKKKKMHGEIILFASLLLCVLGLVLTDTNEVIKEEVITEATPVKKTDTELEEDRKRIKEEYEKAQADKLAAEQNPKAITVTKVEEKEIQSTPVDKKIETAVIAALGKKNNMEKPTINSIEYVERDKGAIVILNANENLTTNLTKKGIWLSSKDLFKEIKEIEEVDLFIFHWHLPLVDTYGNEKDGLVMAFQITKDDLQKINYDNFLTDNVPKVVGNYFEHAAFKE